MERAIRVVIVDIETPWIPVEGSHTLTEIYCVVTKELDQPPLVWTEQNFSTLVPYLEESFIVAHNGLSFDIPVLRNVLGVKIETKNVLDTFVLSRLISYSRFNTHSLDEIGQYLKFPKGKFSDFSGLSQEMIDYCVQDVKVTEKFYKMYEKYLTPAAGFLEAIQLEQSMTEVNYQMSIDGFLFDTDKARSLLVEIEERLSFLENEFQTIWPPELQESNRIQFRVKKDGTLWKNVEEFYDRYPKVEQEGLELVGYDWVKFNPGSTKDRIEKLWAAGWEPMEKTKTHNRFIREARVGELWGKTKLTEELYQEKKDHFSFYGYVVNELNLQTLPSDAPEGAHKLAEWLCLEGRRSSLAEWLGCVHKDNRIRGKFWTIGAWTHRMSHSSPNQANIFSPFKGEVRTSVDQVKKDYDRSLRALWKTDKVLVGTDADGVQLRILCHKLRSIDYREAILNGRKEDKTDIHNLNLQALKLEGLIRDDAKTFIYAWLLGAGTAKVASILRCSKKEAKRAVLSFVENTTGLSDLKRGQIPSDAKRGYFIGLDGRKVVCDSEHLMLAGYLQNGEAVAMKRWIIKWHNMAKKEGLWFRQVDFVHDEVQVEVDDMSSAERLIEIQKQAMFEVSEELDLFCPLEVSGDVGYNWAETH